MARLVYSQHNFQCTTCDCVEKRYKWSNDEVPEICSKPDCKGEMIEIQPEELPGSPAYNKFNSLSSDTKKALLKKRSHDHFVKSGLNEKRHVMLNGQWDGSGADTGDYKNGKRVKRI